MKKVIVLSLGGSLIIPEKIDFKFLHEFKNTLQRYYSTHKFVIVCGGGIVARLYIDALKEEKLSEKDLSLAGIRATRMNASFLMQFFGEEANDYLPTDMKDIANCLKKNDVVICGALRFVPHSTSDGTAARIAHHFNSYFVNLTNVTGLYDSDPRKNKDAKFIAHESWKDFERRALAIKHKPGQHFVLDQEAAVLIEKSKIDTYIVGKDIDNFKRIIEGKPFKGTLISG